MDLSKDLDPDDDNGEYIPVEVMEAANIISLNLLPEKSRKLYTKRYNDFKSWRTENKIINSFAEDVLLCYFNHLEKSYCSSTLWAYFSMIKSCAQLYDKVDISGYNRLVSFIKLKHKGYKAKKAKTLTSAEVAKFCHEAPDSEYLVTKAILVVGVSGCCRRKELTDLIFDNVVQLDNMLLVTIPYTKTYVERSFVVVGEFYNICKRYLSLRPDVPSRRLFLTNRNGKFINLPVGINTVGSVPRTVALFLNLPDPELYTSHCIRRTSATIYVEAGATESELMTFGKWKSPAVARGYHEQSMLNKEKVGQVITNAVIHSSVPTNSTAKPMEPMVSLSSVRKHNNLNTAAAEFPAIAPDTSSTVPKPIVSRPLSAIDHDSLPDIEPDDSGFASTDQSEDEVNYINSSNLSREQQNRIEQNFEFHGNNIPNSDTVIKNSINLKVPSSVKEQSRSHRASVHEVHPNHPYKQYGRPQHGKNSSNIESLSNATKHHCEEESAEFSAGNSSFKFFNCSVIINVSQK